MKEKEDYMKSDRIKNGLLLLTVLSGSVSSMFAGGVELWPGDRRNNKTQFCFGNDWNMLRFAFYSDSPSRKEYSNAVYNYETPKPFTEETVLEVTLPGDVEFLGVFLSAVDRVSKDIETASVMENEKKYMRVHIPLDNTILNRIMEKRSYDEVHLWYKAPEQLDDRLSWTLTYGGKVLASSTLRLRTAGVMRAGQKLPKRFGFFPYGHWRTVPDDNFDELADFYKRFGITGITVDWFYGKPDGEPQKEYERYYKTLQANRRYGVKNIANMTKFCDSRLVFGRTDLIKDADSCANIEAEEAKQAWKAACPLFDMAHYDWEPPGPRLWPGYSEPETIAAFAKAKAIKEPLTEELLRTKYRDAYARFRMEQQARAPGSLRKMLNAVKPMPLFICQGDGYSRNIDYDVYADDCEYLQPMMYIPTPLAFARTLLEMLNSTSVPARKFVPFTTTGWGETGSHRETPEEFLMDTMVLAAAGCGGVSHWPSFYLTDGTLFGIHDGLTRIALVEDFYFDGKSIETISVKGIPYREEKINLGNKKTLELFAPDWRPMLLRFQHQLKDEYLLSILNYHKDENAFVKISSPTLKNYYLVDPVEKVYCVCDDTGRAIVRVEKESPSLWIATKDKARIEGYKRIDPKSVEAQLKTAREKYLKTNKTGDVQLGKVGNIDVTYDEIKFGGDSQICLRVSTSDQTFFFGDSGGRIYDWAVKDMPSFIAKESFSTDGFGMDLLWLPSGARWSGDEVQPMKLIQCTNNGKEARIVYEGEFKSALPGVMIQKEYIIPATGTSFTGVITLKNSRVSPVTLSYWQHNILKPVTVQFIPGTEKPILETTGTSIFPAEGLPEEHRLHIVRPNNIAGTTKGVCAEYFPESKSGLIFRHPTQLMNIYRWNSLNHAKSGHEWMSQPLTLPAGGSETLQYSIAAVPKTNLEALRKQLK